MSGRNFSTWWSCMNEFDEGGGERQPIQTLVFMDFETTGLFQYDHDTDPLLKRWIAGDYKRRPEKILNNFYLFSDCTSLFTPRITEMSFLSVPRSLFATAVHKMKDKHTLTNDECGNDEKNVFENISVRIASNVHTRQLNPNLSEKEWRKYDETMCQFPEVIHLSKEELLTKNTFDIEWRGLREFFAQMPKPACLIAHNGLRFDCRVLLQELRRYNLFEELPTQLYFLDTYLSFLDIEKSHHDDVLKIAESINWRMVTNLVLSASESKIRQTNYCNGTPMQSETQADEAQINNDQSPSTNCLVSHLNNTVLNTPNPKETLVCIPEINQTSVLGSAATQQNAETILKRTAGNANLPLNSTPLKRVNLAESFRWVHQLSKSNPPMQKTVGTNSPISTLLPNYRDAHPLRFINTVNWPPALKRRLRTNLFR